MADAPADATAPAPATTPMQPAAQIGDTTQINSAVPAIPEALAAALQAIPVANEAQASDPPTSDEDESQSEGETPKLGAMPKLKSHRLGSYAGALCTEAPSRRRSLEEQYDTLKHRLLSVKRTCRDLQEGTKLPRKLSVRKAPGGTCANRHPLTHAENAALKKARTIADEDAGRAYEAVQTSEAMLLSTLRASGVEGERFEKALASNNATVEAFVHSKLGELEVQLQAVLDRQTEALNASLAGASDAMALQTAHIIQEIQGMHAFYGTPAPAVPATGPGSAPGGSVVRLLPKKVAPSAAAAAAAAAAVIPPSAPAPAAAAPADPHAAGPSGTVVPSAKSKAKAAAVQQKLFGHLPNKQVAPPPSPPQKSVTFNLVSEDEDDGASGDGEGRNFNGKGHWLPFAWPELQKDVEAAGYTAAVANAQPELRKKMRHTMAWLKWYFAYRKNAAWGVKGPTLEHIWQLKRNAEFQATPLSKLKLQENPAASSWYEVRGCTGRPGAPLTSIPRQETPVHVTPYNSVTTSDVPHAAALGKPESSLSSSPSSSGGSSEGDSEGSSGGNSDTEPSSSSGTPTKSASTDPASPPSSDPPQGPSKEGSSKLPASENPPAPPRKAEKSASKRPPPSPPTSDSESDSSAAAKKREKRKRQKANRLPKLAPILTGPTETERKRNIEFRKSMSALDPKISDFSKRKEVEKWEVEVEEAARVHYGPLWRENPEVIHGAILATGVQLKDSWRADRKRNPEGALSWKIFMTWILAHVDREVRNDARDAMQQLIEGRYHQKGKALYRYLNLFRRIIHEIPECTESQQVQWFLNGLSDELRPECQTDLKGRPWKKLDDLVKHAAAQEIRNKTRIGKPKSDQTTHNKYGKNRLAKTLALAALKKKKRQESRKKSKAGLSTDKPDPSLAVATQAAGASGGSSGQGQKGQGGRFGSSAAGSGRGAGGGGGRGDGGGRGVNTGIRDHFTGDAKAPFAFNRNISEGQAEWLAKGGKCWHCYLPMETCRQDRATQAHCNLKGHTDPLAKGSHGGAPGWN